MKSILIHCKPSYLKEIKRIGLDYIIAPNGEVDVTVSDIDYDLYDAIIDPDIQLCEHYCIDYDQVNCLELA